MGSLAWAGWPVLTERPHIWALPGLRVWSGSPTLASDLSLLTRSFLIDKTEDNRATRSAAVRMEWTWDIYHSSWHEIPQ